MFINSFSLTNHFPDPVRLYFVNNTNYRTLVLQSYDSQYSSSPNAIAGPSNSNNHSTLDSPVPTIPTPTRMVTRSSARQARHSNTLIRELGPEPAEGQTGPMHPNVDDDWDGRNALSPLEYADDAEQRMDVTMEDMRNVAEGDVGMPGNVLRTNYPIVHTT